MSKPIRVVLSTLLGVNAFLAIGYIATQQAIQTDRQAAQFIRRLFHPGADPSLGSWFSGILLAGIGLMALAIWWIARLRAERSSRFWPAHWLVIGIAFLGLSLDEVAVIHETLGSLLGPSFGFDDDDFWPVLYLPAILVTVWALVRVARELEGAARTVGVLAIVALVAAVMSDLGPAVIGWEAGGAPGFTKSLIEENLELLGVELMFVTVLIACASRALASGVLRLPAPRPAANEHDHDDGHDLAPDRRETVAP